MHRSTSTVQSTSAGGTAGTDPAAPAAGISLRMTGWLPPFFSSRSIAPANLPSDLPGPLPFEGYPVTSLGDVAGDHKPLVRERFCLAPSIPGHVATALMGRNTWKNTG